MACDVLAIQPLKLPAKETSGYLSSYWKHKSTQTREYLGLLGTAATARRACLETSWIVTKACKQRFELALAKRQTKFRHKAQNNREPGKNERALQAHIMLQPVHSPKGASLHPKSL